MNTKTVNGVAHVRVTAAPGRMYPHPGGHRAGQAARYIGRGFDSTKSVHGDVDARFPIKPEGVLLPLSSELVRAVQNGDLVEVADVPVVPVAKATKRADAT
jgi:hypothetical protein